MNNERKNGIEERKNMSLKNIQWLEEIYRQNKKIETKQKI